MGYETKLYLVDVEIKSDSLAAVEKTIKTKKGKGLGSGLIKGLGKSCGKAD